MINSYLFFINVKYENLLTSTTLFFGGRPRFLLNIASRLVLSVIEMVSLFPGRLLLALLPIALAVVILLVVV